ATALIRYFLDSQYHSENINRGNRILYFGSNIGIRKQLCRTRVKGLGIDLSEVFSQLDVSRDANIVGSHSVSKHSNMGKLPRVTTIYSPDDPSAILETYKPPWVAIDFGDSPSLTWLQPLLRATVRLKIPVVAWGNNPLSECVKDFSSFGHIFAWPPTLVLSNRSSPILNDRLDILLYPQDSISMTPVVLQGESANSFSSSLQKAYHHLSHITQHIDNEGFKRDTIAVHWKYLRSLESLAVPIDFYEAEAQRFWGLQSFSKLMSLCNHFRSACVSNTYLYRNLEEVAALLDKAKDYVQTLGCPLWEALVNLCIEDVKTNEVRLLVFHSDSKKRLYLFSLLARHNTTEDDLHKMRIYVTSLKELRRWMYACRNTSEDSGNNGFPMPMVNTNWHPILIGLPSPVMTPWLFYPLLYPKNDIILYPHQCSSFIRKQGEWSVCLSGDFNRNINSLSFMSGVAVPNTAPLIHGRISLEQPVELNVESTAKKITVLSGPIWQPDNTVNEVANLFKSDDDCIQEELILNDQPSTEISSTADYYEEICCAEAIRVQFDQGWHAYFAPDDVINVVCNELNLRHVRSLRTGDRVLVIHGQQRQNLYDLLISRVHRHPSIELHLALIRRWQEDFRMNFNQWCASNGDLVECRTYGIRDLNGLLRRMQAKGSMLVTPLSLAFWLRGDVLCPLDQEDLRRVAEVLNMGFVQKYYKHISQAASRLRGLHRGLSNRLNRWLQDQVTGVIQGNDDAVIDSELGLTFGDVRNSLLILRVIKLENVAGPFLRSNLGQVEKDI
ncbi:hypothetical protein ACQ9LF_13805, partial [Anaerohalosphaeraceae bacterium U12dextr]